MPNIFIHKWTIFQRVSFFCVLFFFLECGMINWHKAINYAWKVFVQVHVAGPSLLPCGVPSDEIPNPQGYGWWWSFLISSRDATFGFMVVYGISKAKLVSWNARLISQVSFYSWGWDQLFDDLSHPCVCVIKQPSPPMLWVSVYISLIIRGEIYLLSLSVVSLVGW